MNAADVLFHTVRNASDVTVTPCGETWGDFCARLAEPVVREHKDGAGVVWADFKTPTRRKANVAAVTALVLDIESKGAEQPPPLRRVCEAIDAAKWLFAAHTSFSHTPARPRYRLIFPLGEPVGPEDLRAAHEWLLTKLLPKLRPFADPSCLGDSARLYYLPSCPSERRGFYESYAGGRTCLPPPSLEVPVAGNDAPSRPADADEFTIPWSPTPDVADDLLHAAPFLDLGGRDGYSFMMGALKNDEAALAAVGVDAFALACQMARTAEGFEGVADAEHRGNWSAAQWDHANCRALFARAIKAGWRAAPVEAPIQPIPLPDDLPGVPAFAPELLPDSIRAWVMDIADRVSCPPDFVAIPAMLALATALGRKVGIRPQFQTDWTEVPNLWGLIVGRPGMLKSPAMAQATAPLKRLAARAQDQYETAAAQWELDQRASKLRTENGEKLARKMLAKSASADIAHLLAAGHPDAEPTLRRYATSNATPEALGELLRQNPQGLMLERDEIMGLLRTLDRDENADHRAFLLEAWAGDGSFTFDRIGRGFNLHIPAMALSVCGTTQPGRLQAYLSAALNGGAADDGLMQRFSMLVWPDATGEWRNVDRWPDGEAKRRAWEAFDRLDRIDPRAIGARQDTGPTGDPEGLPYLRLDEAAHGVFLEWRTELERRLRSGDLSPALESHLAKFRKLAPALALVGHLAGGGTGAVREGAMRRALAWAEYLEGHARRAYGSAQAPEVATAKLILARIKRGDLPRTGFGSRDAWRPGWAGLRDRDAVTAGLSYLVDMVWLIESQRETEGRTATLYALHPEACL